MDQPDFISELEASMALGSNRAAFSKFLERHGIEPVTIAGGRVFSRSKFYDAVRVDMAGRGAQSSPREPASGAHS